MPPASTGPARTGATRDPAPPRVAVLRGLPVRLFLRLGHHLDELSREVEVLGGPARPPAGRAAEVGAEFLRLLDACAVPRRAAVERAEAAAADGRDRFDLPVRLSPAAAGVAGQLVRVLDRADELSRDGVLLTLAAPAEVARLRRWIAEELEAQLTAGGGGGTFPEA